MHKRSFLAILILVLIVTPTCLAIPREDPSTGRLRVLFIGTAFWGTSPGRILLLDPKLDPTLVPIITVWYTDEDNARYMRLYMPKSYKHLVESKDLIELAGVDAVMITPRLQNDFSRAVVEGGLGMLYTDGHRGFGGASAQKAEWKGTQIEEEILPVWVYTNEFVDGPIKMRVLVPENPMMRSLPWETAPPLTRLNKLTIKEGATKLSDDGANGYPVLAYWDLGLGRSSIFGTDLHGSYAYLWVHEWIYWHDFLLNLIYYSCGIDVPDDPEMMHLLRDSFFEYSARTALLRDMMGFVEKFGANPASISDRLSILEDEKKKVDQLYLEQSYPDSLQQLRGIIESMKDLEREAVDLKDRALIWIYLIEYLVVTGTSMVAGAVLWTLLVRRRLYREMGTTRGGQI
jgi:hypothetical protein